MTHPAKLTALHPLSHRPAAGALQVFCLSKHGRKTARFMCAFHDGEA